MEVEPRRFNVFAQWGEPLIVTLSTHIDTVPPFFTSREDAEFIWGRGACDTKGIIASMIKAVEALLADGHRGFGLLFVVGEERNSAGAYKAGARRRAARATSSTASPPKTGSRWAARARCATRSAPPARWPTPPIPNWAIPPSTSCSTSLADIRRIPLPVDPLLGPSTLNIGTLAGGRAPNVIADEARADIMIRLVGDSSETKAALRAPPRAAPNCARSSKSPPSAWARWTASRPPWWRSPPISRPSAAQWGEPFLIGPGTIHVAHTLEERVPKAQLTEAVDTLPTHRKGIMQTRIEVGILGATGMVGQHFIKFLQGNPWFDLKWLGASDRSAGKKYKDAMTWHLAGGTPDTVAGLTVDECKPGNAPRLLFSAMDAGVATEIERAFAQAGHVVVSNSRNHRMERDVPLLVPEINPDHLKLVPGQQRAAAGKARSSPIRTAPPSAW